MKTYKTIKYITFGILLACVSLPAISNTIQGHQIRTSEGEAVFIRGMAYSPEPVGFPGNPLDGQTKEGWNYNQGAWLCMVANQYHPQDWEVSPCEDSDLFGLMTFNTLANNAYNDALQKKWEHDLSDMQQMGVNTLRLYNINPTGKNHKAFLDKVREKNMYVIYPILTYYLARDVHDDAKRDELMIKMIQEVCGHPAILAYTVGNELAAVDDPNTARIVNRTIKLIKEQCSGALVTYAAVDDPNKWALRNGASRLMETIPDVDIITVNAGYRGDGNNPSNTYFNLFEEIKTLIQHYGKAFLIGEMGVHDHDDAHYRQDWFNAVWGKYVLQHSKQASNLGVVYFEYNDEPYGKNKRVPIGTSHDSFMGITTAVKPTHSKDTVVSLANQHKRAAYTGRADLNTLNIKSDYGKSRYEMFVNNETTGIKTCNYVKSPGPDNIDPACDTASNTNLPNYSNGKIVHSLEKVCLA